MAAVVSEALRAESIRARPLREIDAASVAMVKKAPRSQLSSMIRRELTASRCAVRSGDMHPSIGCPSSWW
jgi:hypothetical protein